MSKRKYRRGRSRRGANPQETLFLIGGVVLVVGGLLTAYQAQLSDAMWYIVVGLLILLPIVGGVFVFLRLARLKRKEDTYLEHKAIETLMFMDPFEFERFIGWVFSRQGYSVTVTRERGDHGLDVQMVKDRTFYAAQVKRYKKATR
jgi:HJR/Mrr/RecB family endonuclease